MADCNNTEVFLSEWKRMCLSFEHCPSCDAHDITCYERCIEANRLGEMRVIVQKWSDEHPLPKPRTYVDDFFEKYPNAQYVETRIGKTPLICRNVVHGGYCTVVYSTRSQYCQDCWNKPIIGKEGST